MTTFKKILLAILFQKIHYQYQLLFKRCTLQVHYFDILNAEVKIAGALNQENIFECFEFFCIFKHITNFVKSTALDSGEGASCDVSNLVILVISHLAGKYFEFFLMEILLGR